jgi:hypothetical protein
VKKDVVLYGSVFFCMFFYSFLHNATKAYISIFQPYTQSSSHLFSGSPQFTQEISGNRYTTGLKAPPDPV